MQHITEEWNLFALAQTNVYTNLRKLMILKVMFGWKEWRTRELEQEWDSRKMLIDLYEGME